MPHNTEFVTNILAVGKEVLHRWDAASRLFDGLETGSHLPRNIGAGTFNIMLDETGIGSHSERNSDQVTLISRDGVFFFLEPSTH